MGKGKGQMGTKYGVGCASVMYMKHLVMLLLKSLSDPLPDQIPIKQHHPHSLIHNIYCGSLTLPYQWWVQYGVYQHSSHKTIMSFLLQPFLTSQYNSVPGFCQSSPIMIMLSLNVKENKLVSAQPKGYSTKTIQEPLL